jgi:transcriptional regulator with XRE-family HTH domain
VGVPARLVIHGSESLAAALKARGLTYEEAAHKLGTSDTFVSMLVNRQRAPGRKVALALRAEFGVPLDAHWIIARRRPAGGSRARSRSRRVVSMDRSMPPGPVHR